MASHPANILKIYMTTTISDAALFIPSDRVLDASDLPDRTIELATSSAKVAGRIGVNWIKERSGRRLLSSLKSDGLISETSSKSPFRWEIPEHAEPWYFPNLTLGI